MLWLCLVVLLTVAVPVLGDTCTENQEYFKDCPPKEVKVSLGERVTLTCKTYRVMDACHWSKGDPPESIRPMKNGDEYQLVTSRESRDNKECSLTILKVSRKDVVEWKCKPFFRGESKLPGVSTRLVHASAARMGSHFELIALVLSLLWSISRMMS